MKSLQQRIFVVFVILIPVSVVLAQKQDQFLTRQEEGIAENPAGVAFLLQTKNNQTRFRQGELISLQLSFSSTQAKKYHLDAATYDRSGRLDIDTFHVDPTSGASDPLSDYFNFFLGGMGGGLRTNPTLEPKPYVITVDLNEWFRFDQPGKYRLYVTSTRVFRDRFYEDPNYPIVTTSNVIELEVIPAEPTWAKQTLARTIATLDSKNAENRRDACRLLRFLGTRDAVSELVKRFDGRNSDGGCEFEIDFGLRSTPHRLLAINEMERQLTAVDFGVTNRFIEVLAFLSFFQENAPPPPLKPNDSEEAVRAAFDRRYKIYEEILESYRQRLLATVFAKNDKARALSLETLLSIMMNGGDSKSSTTEAAKSSLQRASSQSSPRCPRQPRRICSATDGRTLLVKRCCRFCEESMKEAKASRN